MKMVKSLLLGSPRKYEIITGTSPVEPILEESGAGLARSGPKFINRDTGI